MQPIWIRDWQMRRLHCKAPFQQRHSTRICHWPDGSVAQAGLDITQVPILVGTLGKAFGTFGAFVAGSDELIETLIQEARTYIYTTAPPPALASATRAALRLVREEDWRRAHLQRLIKQFRSGARQLGLALCESETPIQPLLAGAADEALRLSQALREQGILITAIRPPTVPAGASRLRITFSANHRDEHVDRLLDVLEKTFARDIFTCLKHETL